MGSFFAIKDYDTASYIAFGIEGGLIISSIITGIISDNKFEDTVYAYNEYLKEMIY